MTVCVAILACVVAIAAAVRSTWSPCGLSMLSTITPISERSKGHAYRSTATWFVSGATAGGATIGGVMALLAMAVRGVGLSPTEVGTIALLASSAAAWSDADVFGVHLPVHRRQVNERWLDHYRAWVYGAGFGWQIGTGLATYITTAAVYLMIVLGALTGRPILALAVGTAFGILRGLAVLLTRNLVHPSDLLAFHRRLIDVGPAVGRTVIGVEIAAAASVAIWLRTPWATAVVIGAVLTALLLPAHRRHRGRAPTGTCTVPTRATRGVARGVTRGAALPGSDGLVVQGADGHSG
ncbi:MAG TPA: hypothetical protein VHW93_06290 [Acidimicrobiales bacterium]|jgi:hypothetical protein|nr:hypothetical protein [Acidimicrobiales bacterium]